MQIAQKSKPFLLWGHRLISQVVDPVAAVRAVVHYFGFLADWLRYRRLPGAERLRLADAYPQLHDRTSTTAIDFHYFYTNGWAMRRIVASAPERHTDIGSQAIFVNLLASVVPVEFLDYRPVEARLSGLSCTAGSILALPYPDRSLKSVSCLHVIEHIGLGRYGDPLDPEGSKSAAYELARVLAPGGFLYLAAPVGRSRVCFNAHRIHSVAQIIALFAGLQLVELSGVHDDGRFVEHAGPEEFSDSSYACGFFLFQRQP
jgi:SAM-dependent methyltransferase